MPPTAGAVRTRDPTSSSQTKQGGACRVACDLCGTLITQSRMKTHRGKGRCTKASERRFAISHAEATSPPHVAATPSPTVSSITKCRCGFIGKSAAGHARHVDLCDKQARFRNLAGRSDDATQSSADDEERELTESRRQLLLDRFESRLHRILLDLQRTGDIDFDDYNAIVDEYTSQLLEWQEEFFKKPAGPKKRQSRERTDAEKKRASDTYEYKKAQFLMHTNRKRLAREIFDDQCDPAKFSSSSLFDYYSGLYATPNDMVASNDDDSMSNPDLNSAPEPPTVRDEGSTPGTEAPTADESSTEETTPPLRGALPISAAEVLAALKGMDSQPAPGRDGLRLDTMRKFDDKGRVMAALFSIAWAAKRIASAWAKLKTIILPKKDKDPHRLANRRPITLSVMLRRVYSRVVKSRLRVYIGHREDVAENVFLLRSALRIAKAEKRQCWIVLLDLKKAFDTVGHAQLIESLRRAGTPPHLVEVVQSLYDNATTNVTHKGTSSGLIMIKCGLLQGCATSPDCFINAINFVPARLHSDAFNKFGFTINSSDPDAEKLVSVRFVDDMGATSDSYDGACALTDESVRLFESVGMGIGLPKCSFFTVNAPEADIKAFADRYGMQHTSEDEFVRYLGAQAGVGVEKEYEALSAKLGARCESLVDYPHLHARQKLIIAQQSVCSLLSFPAQTDFDAHIERIPAIKRLGVAVKHLYRSVLGVNGMSLPDAVLFGPKTTGLLGLPNPNWSMALNGAATAIRLKRSPDARVRSIASQQSVDFDAIAEHHLRALSIGHARPTTTSPPVDALGERFFADSMSILHDAKKMKCRRISGMLRDAILRQWTTTLSGLQAGITLPLKRPSSLAWLVSPAVSDKALTFGLKALVGLLPLRTASCMRNTSGSSSFECRGCGAHRESPAHVLGGECPTTNGQAIARHDGVVEAIVTRINKAGYNEANGWATTVDLPMRDADGRQLLVHARRPDIILANVRLDKCFVLDVAVCYESSAATLEERAQGKVEKYDYVRRFLLGQTDERPPHVYKEVIMAGLVFGARGSVPLKTAEFLTSHFQIDDIWPNLSVQLLKGTHAMYGRFESTSH